MGRRGLSLSLRKPLKNVTNSYVTLNFEFAFQHTGKFLSLSNFCSNFAHVLPEFCTPMHLSQHYFQIKPKVQQNVITFVDIQELTCDPFQAICNALSHKT